MSNDPVVDALDGLAAQVDAIADRVESPVAGDNVQVPKWVAAAVFVTMLGLLVSAVVTFSTLSTRVTVIENTRFTNQDGDALRREIERNIPPPDVRRRLTDHERRLDRIEERQP